MNGGGASDEFFDLTRSIWRNNKPRQARRPEWRFDQRSSRRLPACQTILDAIGDLLADGRQVEEFLFAEDIFGFFGKLPIHHRLVPKEIIPIHACHCAEDLS